MEQVNQPASQPQNQPVVNPAVSQQNQSYQAPKNGIGRFIPLFIILGIFIYIVYSYNNGLFSFLPSGDSKDTTIELVFHDKTYSKNYTKAYSANTSVEIVGFEEKEAWKGNVTLDDALYYEGQTSLNMTSKDREPAVAFAEKSVNLSEMETIKMLTYIAKDEDNIESLTVRFGSKDDSSYYEYPVTSIKKGWNVVKMSKESFTQNDKGKGIAWNMIEKVTISLTARKNAKAEVNFDRMWAERDTDLIKEDVKSLNPDNLSYKLFKGKTYLNVWSIGTYFASIKPITSVKNFIFTAKVLPQKKGPFGVVGRLDTATGYGYYLVFDGIDTGSWKLYRVGKAIEKKTWVILDEGSISNFLVEKDKPFWLRMEVSGSKIKGSFSTDGENYTKLVESVNNEYKNGGVGIYSGSSMLLENVDFSQ